MDVLGNLSLLLPDLCRSLHRKSAGSRRRQKDFFEIVLDLHRRLLLGEKIGKAITGYSTLIFAVILLSGLVIWYPRKMSKSMLKGMFFIKNIGQLEKNQL